MVPTVLRYVEVVSLATWVGGIVFFGAILAPDIFLALSNRDLAGAIVRTALERLHWLGYAAGAVFLAARVAQGRLIPALAAPAVAAVVVMLLVTAASQHGVSRKMKSLRAAMGSVEATPPNDPRRIEFNQLHRVSVRLEIAVLLAGLAALFFLLREGPP